MTDYYVDGDNGDNGNAGTSEGAAKATIQAAVDIASAFDTIYVQNNGSTVYNEMVTVNDLAKLTLIGYGTTVDDGVRAVIDGEDTRANCLLLRNTSVANCDYTVTNFECLQATGAGVNLLRGTGGSNSRHKFDNIWSHDNGTFGFDWNWPNGYAGYISRSKLNLNGSHGIQFSINSGSTANLAFCTIVDNVGEGIRCTSPSASPTLAYCIVARNSVNVNDKAFYVNCVLDAADGSDNYISNGGMLIYTGVTNATAFGIDVGTLAPILFATGFYNNSSGNVDGTPLLEVGTVSGNNPGYADAANNDFTPSHASWLGVQTDIGLPDSPDMSTFADIGPGQIEPTGGGGSPIYRRIPTIVGA